MNRLKEIEKEIRSKEYIDGQVGFYFCCDLVEMTHDNTEPLKEILIKNKTIGSDNEIELVRTDDWKEDFTAIADEWHFDEGIRTQLMAVIEDADVYYTVKFLGPDAENLSNWCSARVIQKGDRFAEMEFYICD